LKNKIFLEIQEFERKNKSRASLSSSYSSRLPVPVCWKRHSIKAGLVFSKKFSHQTSDV